MKHNILAFLRAAGVVRRLLPEELPPFYGRYRLSKRERLPLVLFHSVWLGGLAHMVSYGFGLGPLGCLAAAATGIAAVVTVAVLDPLRGQTTAVSTCHEGWLARR